jgi:uncharacterized membrane protein
LAGTKGVALCFAGRHTASGVIQEIMLREASSGYKVHLWAVVEVDDKGKAHVHEPSRGGLGTGLGAVTGGVLGLIGGPAGLLIWTVAGGVIGGIAGTHVGRAIPEDKLKELGEQMQPDTSAVLALLEDTHSERLIGDLQGYNATVVTLTVGDELSGEIAAAVAVEVTPTGATGAEGASTAEAKLSDPATASS